MPKYYENDFKFKMKKDCIFVILSRLNLVQEET